MRKLLLSFAVLFIGTAVVHADAIPNLRSRNDAMSPWTVSVYNDSGADIATGMVVNWDYTDSDLNTDKKPYVTIGGGESAAPAGVVYGKTCKAASDCEIAVFGPIVGICDDSTTTIDAGDALGANEVNVGHLNEANATAHKRVVGWAMTAEGGADGEECVFFANFIGPTQMQ